MRTAHAFLLGIASISLIALAAPAEEEGLLGAMPPQLPIHAHFVRVKTPIRPVERPYWTYAVSSPVKLVDSYQPQAADGVRLVLVDGELHDHPVVQAEYALGL